MKESARFFPASLKEIQIIWREKTAGSLGLWDPKREWNLKMRLEDKQTGSGVSESARFIPGQPKINSNPVAGKLTGLCASGTRKESGT